jgi:hypothetical protein
MKELYRKFIWEGGMTAKISADYITIKPKQGIHGEKRQDFKFLKSKPEIVEMVAKQMLEAVEKQKELQAANQRSGAGQQV